MRFLTALGGGVLIGLAASLLLWTTGRIAGVSGILGGALAPRRGDFAWRALFLTGLVAGGAVVARLHPPSSHWSPPTTLPLLVAAGLLVGYGTSLGSGCTSGHGVCGIARLSPRSLVATACFMASGFLVVFVLRHLVGGRP